MLHIATLAVFSVTSPEPAVHQAIFLYPAFRLHIATWVSMQFLPGRSHLLCISTC